MKHPDSIQIGAVHRFIQVPENAIFAELRRDRELDTFDTYTDAELMALIRNPDEKGFRPVLSEITTRMAKNHHPAAIISEYHNLVPNVLKFALANLISGTTVTPTFKANYYALGTSATAPAAADTQLGTETLRQLFTNRFAEANTAYLNVYFTNAQVAGNTYLEAAIIVDGGAGANTGYMLSHLAINQSVAALNTLICNCTFSIL